MEDSELPLKELIEKALNDCHDPDLLDLIYKLLTFNQ